MPEGDIAGVQTGERFEIDIELIDLIDGHQHRLSRDEHQEAARLASMEHEGQFTDILVRRSKTVGRFELIDGEGRLTDAKKLKQPSIGARILQANDAEAAIISLQANHIRQGVNPMEFAYGLSRAIDKGMPMEECLKRLGKQTPDGKPDMAFGKKMMTLLSLAPEEQEMVAKGLISQKNALELAQLESNIRSRVLTTAKEIEGEKKRTAKKSAPKAEPEETKTSALKLKPSTGETPKGPPPQPNKQAKKEEKISDKSVREAKKKVGVKDGPRFIGMRAVKEFEEKIDTTDKLDDEQKKLVKRTIDYLLSRRKTSPF